MAYNVEIKARVRDITYLLNALRSLAKKRPSSVRQRDTFFNVNSGRLKLREEESGATELIFYDRPDTPGPKLSSYFRHTEGDASAAHSELVRKFGVRGVVTKDRTRFPLRQKTIVNLDRVENLGDFVEIEVTLDDPDDEEPGRILARQIMRTLGIQDADLEESAYIDLLEGRGATNKQAERAARRRPSSNLLLRRP